jgi:ERCC4-type nuclease
MLSIIIDTREQRPWSFPPHLAMVRTGTLRIGDYAIEGDSMFAIERKSLDDFLGSISTGWERLEREIWRMDGAGFQARVIIVEGDYVQCCFVQSETGSSNIDYPDHIHSKLTPQFIMARIARLTMMGVSVLFAHNADLAAGLAIAILTDRWRELIYAVENGNDKCPNIQSPLPKIRLEGGRNTSKRRAVK